MAPELSRAAQSSIKCCFIPPEQIPAELPWQGQAEALTDVYGVIIRCQSLLALYRGILSRESAPSSLHSLGVTFMGAKGNCSTAPVPNVPSGHCLGAQGSPRLGPAPESSGHLPDTAPGRVPAQHCRESLCKRLWGGTTRNKPSLSLEDLPSSRDFPAYVNPPNAS